MSLFMHSCALTWRPTREALLTCMRKVLVGKITKAINGTLLGALLFYNKLKGVLVDLGFEINEYVKELECCMYDNY